MTEEEINQLLADTEEEDCALIEEPTGRDIADCDIPSNENIEMLSFA